MFSLVLFVVILIVGCNHEMPTETKNPVTPPPQLEKIAVFVNGGAIYDTAHVLFKTQTVFNLKTNSGSTIKYWSTKFSDSSSTYSGSVILRSFSLPIGVLKLNITMTITGIDSLGATHIKVVALSIFRNPEIKFISVEPSANAGKMIITMAADKNALRRIDAKEYYHQGNYSGWLDVVLTDSAHINYWAGLPIVGAQAPWIGLVFEVPVGKVEMGIGRLLTDGSKWWATFASIYIKNGLITFFVNSNGTIDTVGSTATTLPGQFGDDNSNPIFRGSMTSEGLTIYLNNPQGFVNKHPFVSRTNSVMQFVNHSAQSQVGSSTWGKLSISYTEMILSNIINLRYGPEISSPLVTSSTRGSKFDNEQSNCLSIQVVEVFTGANNNKMTFVFPAKNKKN